MKIWHLDKELDAFLASIVRGREGRKANVRTIVEGIKKDVLERGEQALADFSMRFDGWQRPYPLKFSEDELRAAASQVSKKDIAILKGMIRNVTAYHKGQLGKTRIYRRTGLHVKEQFVPVERALVYVPGGRVPYPSSLVMGAVPARLAGVREIYATTPAHDGEINPYIAAACLLLEVTDVYRVGGAQAIYAFAYGVGALPKVDMIVGPGNAYVEEAKRDVYGHVGIDMLAGPTELIVLATGAFEPAIVAWDLFSQAEHDDMATVGLFAPSRDDLYALMKQMEKLIASATRRETVERALENNGFLVHYGDLDGAIQAIDRIAPEHLEVMGDEAVAERIQYPGIIYVGPYACAPMGDYYIGTNHVLPTGGAGRFSAGLSVDRFTKRKVLVKIERSFFDRFADDAMRLAEVEGLQAHGQAIRARKELLK